MGAKKSIQVKKPNHYDLLICLRCHTFYDHVIDTAESVVANTDPKTTKLVFAIDKVDSDFTVKMVQRFGLENVYVAQRKWGWGAGLFGMLCRSILYFSGIYNYSHFMTIDYDTLFLAPDVDRAILDEITDPNIGLLGVLRESDRWQKMFRLQKVHLRGVLGTISPKISCKEGLQGGAMVLTNALITSFDKSHLLRRCEDVVSHTQIADDHLLPLIAKMHGFTIKDISKFARCSWKMAVDPRGLEKRGKKIFHPVKSDGNKNQGRRYEYIIRGYFKDLRKKQRPKSHLSRLKK